MSEPEQEEATDPYQRPSLVWVLLTRFDGLVLTICVAGAMYLMVKTMLSLHGRLEAANADLQQLRSGAPPPPTSPLRGDVSPQRLPSPYGAPAMAQPHPAAAAAAQVPELTAQVERLQHQCDGALQGQVVLRQQLDDAELRLRAKTDELDKLYVLVNDAGDESTICAELRAEAAAAQAAEQAAISARCHAEEEASALRARLSTLEATEIRARELERTVEELSDRLRASDEKVVHSQTVWDMVVQQYGGRPDAHVASPSPLLSTAPTPASRLAQPYPTSLPPRTRSPRRYSPLPASPVSPSPVHLGPSLPSVRHPSPPPSSTVPAFSARGGGKWYNSINDDSAQQGYLRSLERQIEMLQSHIDNTPQP